MWPGLLGTWSTICGHLAHFTRDTRLTKRPFLRPPRGNFMRITIVRGIELSMMNDNWHF